MKGSDLCIVPLEVNEVEEVLWGLLIPLLPETHTHTDILYIISYVAFSCDASPFLSSPHWFEHRFGKVVHFQSQFEVMSTGLHHYNTETDT